MQKKSFGEQKTNSPCSNTTNTNSPCTTPVTSPVQVKIGFLSVSNTLGKCDLELLNFLESLLILVADLHTKLNMVISIVDLVISIQKKNERTEGCINLKDWLKEALCCGGSVAKVNVIQINHQSRELIPSLQLDRTYICLRYYDVYCSRAQIPQNTGQTRNNQPKFPQDLNQNLFCTAFLMKNYSNPLTFPRAFEAFLPKRTRSQHAKNVHTQRC